MKKAFDHVGIITLEPHPGESWVEFSQVWVTNPRAHPARIEYIRPKVMPDVPREPIGLWKLWHRPHVAYRVDDLREAIRDEEVVLGPFDPRRRLRRGRLHPQGRRHHRVPAVLEPHALVRPAEPAGIRV